MINIKKYSVKLVIENSSRYDIINRKLSCPEDVVEVARKVLELCSATQEHFCIVTLDTKNQINGVFTVTTGIVNASLVHPREVFQRAILNNANAIMLIHNHPSGDPDPSAEDKGITKRLIKAGELLGIQVLDHVIIGEDCHVSFKEEGLM